jgi:hypothetical protein
MARKEGGGRPYCPSCGRWLRNLNIRANDDRMTEATGECSTHGRVDLPSEFWDWDLYSWDEPWKDEPCPAP